MIKAIVQIGDMIKDGILELFSIKEGTNLICLNFKTDSEKTKDIEIRIDQELTSEFLTKTGYIGIKRGSGKEYSVIFPGEKIRYIGLDKNKSISSNKFSLLNIKEELKKDKTKASIVQKLDFVISKFYIKTENKEYHLKNADEILKRIKSINGDSPFYIQVCIDNVPLWKHYKRSFKTEVIETNSRCLGCGKREILKDFDTNQLKFLKFFGKDKLGFLPELSLKNQWKVLPLCFKCSESIVLADVFLKENGLNIKISGQLNLLVLPDILYWRKFSKAFIKRTFDRLIKATNVLADWSELNQFDVYAEKIFKTDEIKLHIVVNVYDGQTLKIYSSLTNIPPSRIKQLAIALRDVSLFIFDNINISLSLKALYKLMAGKSFIESKKSILIKEKFAEVFRNLILGNNFSDLVIIKPGIELARWQFENRNSLKWKLEWIDTIRTVEGFLLIKRIMAGKEFNGGKSMSNIFEEAKKYTTILPIYQEDIGEIRKGLFFLGYIIAKIGAEQRKKGLNETILDKIQFRGMNKDQVLKLFNQVFEYMKIYDLQRFVENKKIIGEIASIFDSLLNKWSLSPEETVYFILSGYAFLTSKLVTQGEKSKQGGIS